MVIREMYLKRIRPFYESELIKVISGVRRCGKSTLLQQIFFEIKKYVSESQLIYINFEDYHFKELYNPDHLFAYIEKKIVKDCKYYLFFDEIQNVDNFELVINSFRATHNVSIFLTGSNSKLLSGELASHLGGRTISFIIMPFTFKEFCTLKTPDTNYQKLFQEYIKYGGFPIVCKEEDYENKDLIISSLYDSIVLKDIIMRNKITSPVLLDKILEYLIGNSSITFSGKKVTNVLNENGIKASSPTVYDYVKYIEETSIIKKAERYDIRGKKVLAFEEKVYVCDFGFFELKKNRVKDEFNLIVETAVFNELIARGYQVYVGKTLKGEVDFIVQKNKKKFYIQAAYLLEKQETIEREFGAYDVITDNYPKYVISLDPITSDREGIKHLNLIDFLLDETLIE